MARIVFLSCHLSGTGHLVRTLTLARAAIAAGHSATVINGGRPLDHVSPGDVDLRQLPPVTIRGLEFGVLRDPSGQIADAGYMATRQDAIASILNRQRPDALVTELYPFGRRVLTDEFEFAIACATRANPATQVFCSVRDIPEPKPKRLSAVADRLRAGYAGVLVHGDLSVAPLAAVWPLPADLAPMIHHTGYIGRPMPGGDRGETIVVSSGGGVLGRDVSALAASAAARSDRPWHILIGGKDGAEVAEQLSRTAPGNARIEPVRPDFPDLLAGAACSVSLCGYNTVTDLLQVQTPAIVIPSTQGGEQEQSLRATALADLPGFHVLSADTTPSADLAHLAEQLADGPRRPRSAIAIDDGNRAIECLDKLMTERSRA